jgi:hypothetical protein
MKKTRSVNPRMAMMAARALRQPEVANPPVNPMAAAASAPGAMPGAMPGMKKGGMSKKCMKEGGMADMAQDKAMIKKAFKQHDSQEHKGGKGTKLKLCGGGKAYASGGKASQLSKANGIAVRGKSKGKIC